MKEISPSYLAALVRDNNQCTLVDAGRAVGEFLSAIRDSAQPPAGLRDEMAMRIVPELVAVGWNTREASVMSLTEFDSRIAKRAYEIADAMLEARKLVTR